MTEFPPEFALNSSSQLHAEKMAFDGPKSPLERLFAEQGFMRFVSLTSTVRIRRGNYPTRIDDRTPGGGQFPG